MQVLRSRSGKVTYKSATFFRAIMNGLDPVDFSYTAANLHPSAIEVGKIFTEQIIRHDDGTVERLISWA